MEIPFYLYSLDGNCQKHGIYKFFTLSMLIDFDYSGPRSMRKCVKDNIGKFSKEEILLLFDLLNEKNRDKDNILIAFEIIKSK